jgi:hypothetical protein
MVAMRDREDWKRWVVPHYVYEKWLRLGLDDDDLQRLEIVVMRDPKAVTPVRPHEKEPINPA